MKNLNQRKPRRNFFDFTSKQPADFKTSQLEIHLEALFDRGINFRDRIITISQEIDAELFLLVDGAITEMEAHNRRAITIRINSEGGSVYDALAIVGRLQNSKCKIITEGYGCIMSAAVLVLACGKERKISNLAWFMTHESAYEVSGRHTEIKDYVKQAEREEVQWAECMAKYSTQDSKFWRDIQHRKDTYFNAQELLQIGVVDEVI